MGYRRRTGVRWDFPLVPCPSPQLQAVIQSTAGTLRVHQPKPPPRQGHRCSRLGPSWRILEASDSEPRQAAANCDKELTGLRNPFSAHWDLGRKGKHGEVTACSRAGHRTSTQNRSSARLRAEHLGSRVDQSSPPHAARPLQPRSSVPPRPGPPWSPRRRAPPVPARTPVRPLPRQPGEGLPLVLPQ